MLQNTQKQQHTQANMVCIVCIVCKSGKTKVNEKAEALFDEDVGVDLFD